MRKTIFCDIDGTLIHHWGEKCLVKTMENDAILLPDVLETVDGWKNKEYMIILTTARPESMREITEKQLQSVGLFYDKLIMGLPRGKRVVVNDCKPNMEETAVGVTVERNKGLANCIV